MSSQACDGAVPPGVEHLRDPRVQECALRRGVQAQAGRHGREEDQIGGWGMWIAHQVSDLVQVRSGRDGTVVRLRMRCS